MNKGPRTPNPLEQLQADTKVAKLRADYNKAQYDYMYYFLEAEKIQPDFMALLAKKEAERLAEQEALTKQIQKQVDEQNSDSPVKTVV